MCELWINNLSTGGLINFDNGMLILAKLRDEAHSKNQDAFAYALGLAMLKFDAIRPELIGTTSNQ